VAETKIELNAQVEDLKTLKEDVHVYIEVGAQCVGVE